jgi:ERCC4-related helicase
LSGKENTVYINQDRDESAWKPSRQPIWRGGAATIWEKPVHTVVRNQVPSATVKVGEMREDPYQGWVSPVSCRKNCVLRDATVTGKGYVPENWYESSSEEEEEKEEEIDISEDWYYEKRSILRGNPVEDLASCGTTTGEIKVCRNAARHWVYPAHIPERKYQLHAIFRSLFSNTLVCYPTGLGKTLIAAVVMKNFVRWFPKSKVVFIAPTKPLVTQQMKACQKFMGMATSMISEMTGRANGESRKGTWEDETIQAYFCTPQTFWNDVKRGICPYERISCVVVDECHRATGQADIVKAIKDMRNSKNCKFRVLGLSATPGSTHEQVQDVIDSLGINTLVFKDETDKDIAPYVHKKKYEIVVVKPMGEGNALRSMLMATLQRIVGDLSSHGHYYGVADAERVTRFGMQQARKVCKNARWPIVGKFVQASILADLRDQLDGYGAKTALSFVQEKISQESHLKSLYSNDIQFANFITSLQKAEGGNPKMEKLREILHDFFATKNKSRTGEISRAIVFASLRDGVASITSTLESMKPLIRAKMFIGQGSGKQGGMKQSEQKQVLSDFSSGECNLLVATCIGEEGLDIPNVDLIVCFDAITSPTRALQRQGRTGRHGEGKIIYLLTAGQEEDRFNQSASVMKKLHSQLKEAETHFNLSEKIIRMLPREFGIPKMAHHLHDDMIENFDKTKSSPTNAKAIEEIERVPLAERLKHMTKKGQRKKRHIITSQSPSTANGTSPVSLEALSLKQGSPWSLSSSFKVRYDKSVESKMTKKQKMVTKPLCKFVDDEASVSDTNPSEEEMEDIDEFRSLQDFLDDDTQNEGQMHVRVQCSESPTALSFLEQIRAKRQERTVQSQISSFRVTPDEYDYEDSFLATSDEST